MELENQILLVNKPASRHAFDLLRLEDMHAIL